MKLKIYSAIIAMLALGACTDDDIVKRSDKAENEVDFTVSLPDEEASRTYYGEPTTGDDNITVWPIYWSQQANNLDQILITAPNALAGRNTATYTVNPATDGKYGVGGVTKVGDVGIQWGEGKTKFYAFYPGNEDLGASFSGTVLTASMPGNQSIGNFTENQNGFTIHTQPDSYVYPVKGSMDCCMMTAATDKEYGASDEGKIELQFKPFATALNINVSGPDENSFIDPVNVTSLRVIANAQISGSFTYDFANDQIKFLGKPVTETTVDGVSTYTAVDGCNEIYVSTLYTDADGVKRGIPLTNTQKMNLQVFMLPNDAVTSLTVKAYTADGRVWTKNLVLTNDSKDLLVPKKLHTCTLPPFIPSASKFDFSTWISQLDPRIYISELSLPGTALSTNLATYTDGGSSGLPDYQVTQLENIKQQFQAGIRVFDVGVWVKDGESLLNDGIDTRIYIADSRGRDTGLNLVPFVQLLTEEMQNNHADEFCVLMIAPVDGGNGKTAVDLYKKIKGTLNLMQEQGMLPSQPITSNTRIYDVRDKVIIKYQLSPSNLSGDDGTAANYNEQLTNIQSWPTYFDDVDAWFNIWTSYATSNASYSPLFYGENASFGSFEFNPATLSGLANGTFHNATLKDDPKPEPGLALTVFNKYIGTASTHWVTTAASYYIQTNLQYERPTNDSDLNSGDWYIFCDQSNAGANMTATENNQGKMATAIKGSYNASLHNKFYMTYCGGVGNAENTNTLLGRYNIDDVTSNLNSKWQSDFYNVLIAAENMVKNEETKELEPIKGANPTYIPFGWVMLNQVSLSEVNNPSTTNTTAQIVQAVIGNNGHQKLILQRDKTRPIGDETPATPASQSVSQQGGTSPTPSGGTLLVKPRR